MPTRVRVCRVCGEYKGVDEHFTYECREDDNAWCYTCYCTYQSKRKTGEHTEWRRKTSQRHQRRINAVKNQPRCITDILVYL